MINVFILGGKKSKEKSVNGQHFEAVEKFILYQIQESRNVNVLYIFYNLLVYI